MHFARVVGLAIVGAVAACRPGNVVWYTTRDGFNPNTLTVTRGTSVEWVNDDTLAHTITRKAGPETWDSGNVAGGGHFTHMFSDTGTFRYTCALHGEPGTIVVR